MNNYDIYDYTLTINDLKKALKENREITIIINGEYYDLREEKEAEK